MKLPADSLWNIPIPDWMMKSIADTPEDVTTTDAIVVQTSITSGDVEYDPSKLLTPYTGHVTEGQVTPYGNVTQAQHVRVIYHLTIIHNILSPINLNPLLKLSILGQAMN